MSLINPEYIEWFDDYIEGRLDEESRLVFEERLGNDPEFKASFLNYEKLLDGLKTMKADFLRDELKVLDSAMSKPIRKKFGGTAIVLWTSAVAAAIVLGLIVTKVQRAEVTINYADYWEPEIGLPVLMSERERWNPVMNAYKQEQWEEAERRLKEIKSDTATYFLGIIAFERKHFENSIHAFSQVPEHSIWRDEAQYRMVVALIAAGEKSEALTVLENLHKKSGFNSQQVNDMLDKLK